MMKKAKTIRKADVLPSRKPQKRLLSLLPCDPQAQYPGLLSRARGQGTFCAIDVRDAETRERITLQTRDKGRQQTGGLWDDLQLQAKAFPAAAQPLIAGCDAGPQDVPLTPCVLGRGHPRRMWREIHPFPSGADLQGVPRPPLPQHLQRRAGPAQIGPGGSSLPKPRVGPERSGGGHNKLDTQIHKCH